MVEDSMQKCDQGCEDTLEDLAAWLKELKGEREKTRWVPVTEMMPENHGEYMITWTTSLAKLNNQGFVGIAEYELTEEFDHENNRFKGEWLLDDYIKNYPDVKVTAWRPLPEPYTEVTDENRMEN